MKKISWLLLVIFLAAAVAGCSLGSDKSDRIVIGGKNFTEQDILVYMMKYIIEDKTGLAVETKPFLGGTSIVAQALDRGDIQIYAEYTGTALINLLQQPLINDPQKAYEKVAQIYRDQKQITWLKPFGFNNTYTLTMREDKAAEMGIEKFSDLIVKAPNLVMGCTPEFLERPDGYKGLREAYGLNFKNVNGMDPGLTYAAARDGKVDVIDGFATDGRIPAFKLKVLQDDKNFFPPYYAAPIVREDLLKRHPQIADALNLLAGKISNEEMAALNAQVDLEKKDAKEVARQWLKSQGLIQ
ncbi:glycine betaine ABC transporter substrate-binding protein [Acetonema longum]|uniref:Substrate-binding region of ABC-type glycine betaine transport system n=1 Tax=Acetonema longum DSM 6540 TaxID=1009370 RepID=F7NHU5_9FIRM|nr:glycine betaine ABC transporter substrate-binding protein [Acetonema longum]EGO64470.1 Substrate-binding region of ABC-type glycine betaine transport system [Acetonema longum DSM 6540]